MGKRTVTQIKPSTEPQVQEVLQTKRKKLEMAASELNTLDMQRIKQIMDTNGAIRPAVLLKSDGTAIEVSFDTTPRLKEVNRIVGCNSNENITFAGQWEDVVDAGDSVLLIMRGKAEELGLTINKNKLQPPFHDAQIPGDILLQRSDADGNVLDFTLKQYKIFQKKEIKEWEPADDDNDEGEEEEDDGEDDDEEGDEEGDEEDEALSNVQIDPAVAQAKLKEFLKDYAKKNGGAAPSEEELRTIKGTIYYMLAKEAANQPFDSEEDEDEEEAE